MTARSNTEEFIKKARTVHGDRYDYSRVVYVNNSSKVEIICPEHESFYQRASSHLVGRGCPECGAVDRVDSRRSNLDEFIEKARAVHGDRYDYSRVVYVNNHTKVDITCPTHGAFPQSPNAHLANRRGCPECGAVSSADNRRSNLDEFIEKARAVHGDRYDYSRAIYIHSQAKLQIICPCLQHGPFYQPPTDHLGGHGCPKCAVMRHTDAKRSTLDEFIEKARAVHGDRYDYSRVVYVNALTKVEIVCLSRHESFYQKPNTHLNGHGCPNCGLAATMVANIRRFDPNWKQNIARGIAIYGDVGIGELNRNDESCIFYQ